jgi:8-amino-7-oxononanoate synthase
MHARSRRTLESNAKPQGVAIEIAGRTLINFCSNDYLGLASDPRLVEALRDGASRYGVGAGAAALLSGYSEAHEVLARALADHTQRERALIFSSGYLANLGVLSGLVGRHDHVFEDRLNHASLIDGVRLSRAHHHRYAHGDVKALQRLLTSTSQGSRFIVTDTVFSMDGDLAPLRDLAKLAKEFSAQVIADDAHGFGVLGDGHGALAAAQLTPNDIPVLVVTFGKALGTAGAAVIGSHDLIDELIQQARTFIYDTALPPAIAYATTAALGLIANDRSLHTRLHSNIQLFKQGLRHLNLPASTSTTPIQPLIVGAEEPALALAADLRERGYYVRAIRPPTVPAGTSRLRICLSAAHTATHIEGLLQALKHHRELFIDLTHAARSDF